MESQAIGYEYLNAGQLAQWLNVSAKSIAKWHGQRRLPYIKVGRLTRFPRHEIERRLLSGKLLYDRKQG